MKDVSIQVLEIRMSVCVFKSSLWFENKAQILGSKNVPGDIRKKAGIEKKAAKIRSVLVLLYFL